MFRLGLSSSPPSSSSSLPLPLFAAPTVYFIGRKRRIYHWILFCPVSSFLFGPFLYLIPQKYRVQFELLARSLQLHVRTRRLSESGSFSTHVELASYSALPWGSVTRKTDAETAPASNCM